jgi:hypothetical protein
LEKVLDNLSGANYFSVIDFAQGYLQVPLATGQGRLTKDSVSITNWVLGMDKNAIWFKRKSGNFF